MSNIEIISLTKSSLQAAINKNKFWSDSYQAPFSINKAKWMLKNERASDDDLFGILAYEDYSLIAFVSMMPDLIKKEDGGFKKIFWSQRWWIAPKYKNTVLPTYTKSNSITEVNNQVVVRFLGEDTKAYYEKQPFTMFSERTRCIIIFNLDHRLLISKKEILKKVQPILKLVDKASSNIISLLNILKIKKRTKNITCKNISLINDDDWSFIESFCVNDIVPKTKDYINWQIDNNQYQQIKKGDNKNLNFKCLLESISENIKNLSFIVKKDNQPIGFVSGIVRGKRFVLRYFLSNEENFDACADALIKSVIKSKCTLIQTENGDLGNRIKSRYINVYSDFKTLVSLVHNDVGLNFKNIMINDRDGNFT